MRQWGRPPVSESPARRWLGSWRQPIASHSGVGHHLPVSRLLMRSRDRLPTGRRVLDVYRHGIGAGVAETAAAWTTMGAGPGAVVPIALGHVQTEGERFGLYDAAFGNTVRTIVSVSLFVIALTAFARTEDRTRALRSGYQSHIAKPVDSAELIATIAALIGRRPH